MIKCRIIRTEVEIKIVPFWWNEKDGWEFMGDGKVEGGKSLPETEKTGKQNFAILQNILQLKTCREAGSCQGMEKELGIKDTGSGSL